MIQTREAYTGDRRYLSDDRQKAVTFTTTLSAIRIRVEVRDPSKDIPGTTGLGWSNVARMTVPNPTIHEAPFQYETTARRLLGEEKS